MGNEKGGLMENTIDDCDDVKNLANELLGMFSVKEKDTNWIKEVQIKTHTLKGLCGIYGLTSGFNHLKIMEKFMKLCSLNKGIIEKELSYFKNVLTTVIKERKNESYSELEEMFSGMEINFYKLSCSEGKCLVLFYRPKELEEYMNQPKLRELIGQYGYKESNIEEMLTHLSERICECTAQGIGFPHEIGAFLGYPTADVQSFIEKEGRDFIMTGYWKVYSNPEKARMIFHEYDRAKVCAVNEYLDGKNIREIVLNQRKWRNL